MANFYPRTVADLRAAVEQANAQGGAHTIHLRTGTTYTFVDGSYTRQGDTYGLYSALPEIDCNLRIIGNGATLERNNAVSDFRLARLKLSSSLQIENLTIQNFKQDYGGTFYLLDSPSSESDLVHISFKSVQFINNSSGSTNGGVLYASIGLGSITIDNCIFDNNQ
ncbi:MAG: hypothetical protein AAFR67_04385, partial [Chloroflexota bacterium]